MMQSRNVRHVSLFISVVFTLLFSSEALAEDDDLLLLAVPAIAAVLATCDSPDITKCRIPQRCEALGGLFFQGNCHVKCTTSNVTQCLVKSTCTAAGGLFIAERCRAVTGTLAQLVNMQGTWEFSSILGTNTFYFDVDDIEPNPETGYHLIGDMKGYSFIGFLIFTPSINSFELVEVAQYSGATSDYRQFELASSTRGSGLHGLSVSSTFGYDMTLVRKSRAKTFQ